MGRDRYRSQVTKLKAANQESKTQYGIALHKGAMPSLISQISKWFNSTGSSSGYNYDIAVLLTEIPTEVLADITCRAVLDCISAGQPMTSTAMKLGLFLEEEARLRSLRNESPDNWNLIQKSIDTRVGFGYKRYSSRALTAHLNLGKDWNNWTPKQRCKVGLVFIDLFYNATGLIEQTTIIDRHKGIPYLKPTSKALAWITKYNDHHESLAPLYLPSPDPCGYRDFNVSSFKVSDKEHLNLLLKSPMEAPSSALRKLQSTPWRINSRVLEVAEYMEQRGIPVGGIQPHKDDLMPPKPSDIADNEESRKNWRREAAKWHHEDLSRRGQRLSVSKALWVAKHFSKSSSDQLYFPHQFDFRGRAYSVPNFLNFQGRDLARGLLEFSEEKIVDRDATRISFITAGMLLWGEPPDVDPEKWLGETKDKILAIAECPESEHCWADAKEPWRFLAWALEAAKWLKNDLTTTRLPICIDASSNGLQIMSMLMCDEVGAEATNCILSSSDPKPNDIYQDVLNETKLILEKTSLGQEWLQVGLDRGLVKSLVMTQPYGCTQFRAVDIVVNWYWSKDNSRFSERLRKASDYLVKSILKAYYNKYPKFKQLANLLNNLGETLGEPSTWTSPSGFPVTQTYYKQRTKNVRSYLFGKVRSVNYNVDTSTLDSAKIKRAFMPNFIHSLDAAIMHIALSRLDPSMAVASVHDCFATHLTDLSTLKQTLLETNADVFSLSPSVFWRKIFMANPLGKNDFHTLMDNVSAINGKLVVDEIRSSRYMYL